MSYTLDVVEIKGTKANIRMFRTLGLPGYVAAYATDRKGNKEQKLVGQVLFRVLNNSDIAQNEFATKIFKAAEGYEPNGGDISDIVMLIATMAQYHTVAVEK